MVQIRVLGPIEAEVGGGKVDLGGPRQRSVLALLLTERGGVVSVDRMIDQLWRGEPPPRAISSLQAYVSNLRRLLEPGRSRRAPATLLVSASPGYALRLTDDAVDAWRFERSLRQAQDRAVAAPAEARDILERALGLWHGPAYAEVADEEWAVAEAARLAELHLVARELLVEVTVRAGGAAQAVPPAEVLTRQQPLREEGWRLLALALWASGRQADALAALRRARRILSEELGLDPGPALVELESAILAQRTDVLDTVRAGAPAGTMAAPAGSVAAPVGSAGGPAPDAAVPLFVGRLAELAALRQAAATARTGGGAVVLVTGDAGLGKSGLLSRAGEELDADGWTVLVGRCPEVDGAPPAWAWVEALRGLARQAPPGDDAAALEPLLGESGPAGTSDASAGRFRLHRAVTAWLRGAAAERPLAVVLDDLHRGDAETLALLESAAADLAGAPVLLITAYRPAEAGDRLEETLAVLARRSPYRLTLAGLPPSDVDILVTSVCGAPVDGRTLAALAERTGGNPFYVREIARLLSSEGALVATSEVPEGIRDVLRRRLARLPPAAVSVLRLAAVAGREVDVELLVDAAEADEDAVLDALEAGVIAGLLTEPAPGRVRFVHALVRDTLYTDLTHLRRGRMHARLAETVRRLRPDDLAALAHHYANTASADTAALAVEYAVRAAELAERRYAYDVAVALLEQALDAYERVPPDGGVFADRDAGRVDLLGRLLRAHVRAGAIAAARAVRQRAVEVADRAGREDLLVAAFSAWTEPTPWQTRPYGYVDRPTVAALDRLLARADLDPVTRCRLLGALVAELSGEDDPRPTAAAAEQLAIARKLGDPELLALALTGCAQAAIYERELDTRERLADELRDLARAQGLPAYACYSEYVSASVAALRGDVPALRRHLDEGLELARQYRMSEPEAVLMCGHAMLANVEGRFDEAERVYATARDRMVRHGSIHAEAFYEVAVATVRLSQGRFAEYAPRLTVLFEQFGGLVADTLAVALCLAGRSGEARAVRRHAIALRPDWFHTFLASMRAMAVVMLGERDAAPELIERLLPMRDQLGGVAGTSMAIRPVAYTLGELYRLLGDDDEAARQFAHAERVARRWHSDHWAAEARAALSTG